MERRAKFQYATQGQLVSYESGAEDVFPPGTSRATATERVIEIANETIPASMAGVTHGRKYQEQGLWILASKRGMRIAAFRSEDALNEWWQRFQKSRGREPSALTVGRPTKSTRRVTKNKQRHPRR